MRNRVLLLGLFIVCSLSQSLAAPFAAQAQENALSVQSTSAVTADEVKPQSTETVAAESKPENVPLEIQKNAAAETIPDQSVSQPKAASAITPPTQGLLPVMTVSDEHVTAATEPLPTRPVLLPPKGPVYISMFEVHPENGFAFIELWNTSSEYQKLDNTIVSLEYYPTSAADWPVCTINLSGYMAPKSYITLAPPAKSSLENNVYSMGDCLLPGGKLVDISISLQDVTSSLPDEKLYVPSPVTAQRYVRKTSSKTGILATDFTSKPANIATDVPRTSALYVPPSSLNLSITEIYSNPRLCATGDVDLTCRPYVKVVNDTDEKIDLSAYRMRSGKPDANASVYNTSSLQGVVPANGYLVISETAEGKPLAMNDSEGATWFEDKLGFVTYENTDAPYEKADTAANRQRAWAYDPSDKSWKWATPSPTIRETVFYVPGMGGEASKLDDLEPLLKPCAANQYRSTETNRCRLVDTESSSLTPCREDQYRSEETNRCRSIAASATSLVPCKEGQYRSGETNRCRSIATAASTLKPCAPDQYRSLETNRCKKIASTEAGLKPCKVGQERNPATNRCRTILATTPPDAAFAVRPIEQTAASTLKWWALGAVVGGAAAYGAWQYRPELMTAFRKIPHVFNASK